MLEDLGRALCLMLVLEGMMPFLAPHRWRKMVLLMAEVNDRDVRMVGLMTMLLGTLILYFLR